MWRCLEYSHLPFPIRSLLPQFPSLVTLGRVYLPQGGLWTRKESQLLKSKSSGAGSDFRRQGWRGAGDKIQGERSHRKNLGMARKWRHIHSSSFPPPIPEHPMTQTSKNHYYYWLFGFEWQEPLPPSPSGWERHRSCPNSLISPERLVLLLDLSLSDSRNTTHSSLCVFYLLPLRTHWQKLD